MIGQTLSHYHVLEKLGEGGMGILYRARDTRLGRDVALKVLRPEAFGDTTWKRRLIQEAKAASALNHPRIVTVHDIGQATVDGREVDFIAMECVAGRGLNRLLTERRLGIGEVLDVGLQIAEALAVAHSAGIIHRDIKPANVMLTDSGQVKVLDFGLAKVTQPQASAGALETQTSPTASAFSATSPGALLGTPSYMSPEQAEGMPADARSDVFALGAVLYEMLAGRRPFLGDSAVSLFASILRDTPPPLRSLRGDVPRDVEQLVGRCLAKNRDDRYASAGEVLLDLTACRARHLARTSGWRGVLRQRRVYLPLAMGAVALVSLAGWAWVRGAGVRWARKVALPQIARMTSESRTETGNYEAYWLAKQAAIHLPGDPMLERFWKDHCYPLYLTTTPPGAEVSVKLYSAPHAEWRAVGRTPLEGVLMPFDMLRWRIVKEGFETVEATTDPTGVGRFLQFTLDALGTTPAGMVRVGGGPFGGFSNLPRVELLDFWLDRYEVTNRQYKEFLDGGGYRKPEYWKQPFVKDGRSLSWSEGIASLVDATGRPGPSGWEAGTYPDGEDEFPVSGVSWYEASAYAEFAGKELPTVFHWWKALGVDRLNLVSDLVHFSNLGGKGPVAVGTLAGMSPFGTFDMAGNVREWCATELRGRRYALGGAWTDNAVAHLQEYAQPPWTRSPTYGLRCARYMGPVAPELRAGVDVPLRDYTTERPVADAVFEAFRSFYAYDPAELRAKVDSVEETPYWRLERVSFDAAYGNERVPAFLFLPRSGKPPYQTLVYSPTGEAHLYQSSADLRTSPFDYIVRSGRAVLYPIYYSTYERQLRRPIAGPADIGDIVTQFVKDLRRGIDYLETRPDIDQTRLAILGISDTISIIAPALDDRLKVTVIQGSAALFLRVGERPPEADAFNFAPRVRVPALVLAGRFDPFADAARWRLLLRLLGAPDADKRLVFVDSGHLVRQSPDSVRETLNFLDKYLGPVEPVAPSS